MSGQPDLQWAQVAMDIYKYLERQTDTATRPGIELSLIELKAHLIGRLGNVKGDPLRDGEQLVDMVLATIQITPVEVKDKIIVWEKFLNLDLPSRDALLQQPLQRKALRENLRVLRRIKNMLNCLQYLVNKQLLEPPEELRVWLSLRKQLP